MRMKVLLPTGYSPLLSTAIRFSYFTLSLSPLLSLPQTHTHSKLNSALNELNCNQFGKSYCCDLLVYLIVFSWTANYVCFFIALSTVYFNPDYSYTVKWQINTHVYFTHYSCGLACNAQASWPLSVWIDVAALRCIRASHDVLTLVCVCPRCKD